MSDQPGDDLANLRDRLADGGAAAAPRALPPLQACPYKELSYLLIEDSETMRVWLRNTIVNAGGVKIDVSDSYNDALYRIRNRGNYDVVLCDYILSDTRDGQQLLEEVRRQKLLPQSTLWIMITGERKYEQVFSAVELAPDDYLIKPISPDMLHERIGRGLGSAPGAEGRHRLVRWRTLRCRAGAVPQGIARQSAPCRGLSAHRRRMPDAT